MKKQKSLNLISRRRFIGGAIMATTAAAMMSACKTSSPSWKIGCYTRAWGDRHYLVALDGMVEVGCKYVGLSTHDTGIEGKWYLIDRDTKPEEAIKVGEEIKKRGLKLVTLSGGNFDAELPIDQGIEQLMRIIDNSAYCGSPVIQLNDIPDAELVDTFYKVIAESCDYAADKGVMITVKPHGSSGAVCRANVEKVGHDNFKVWYDPGNVCYYSKGQTDPVEDAATLDGIVVGMAVKDFQLPQNVNITPGTGIVDFPKLIARMQQGGFDNGPLIIECLAPGDLAFTNAEAKKTLEFLENITNKL